MADNDAAGLQAMLTLLPKSIRTIFGVCVVDGATAMGGVFGGGAVHGAVRG